MIRSGTRPLPKEPRRKTWQPNLKFLTNNTLQNQSLQSLLEISRSVRLLLPAYRQVLNELAAGDNLAMQKAVLMILKREKPADLQSVYFTEEVLRNFVEKNLQISQTPGLLQEYRDYARQLINNFLFFNEKEKAEILPYLDTLDLAGLKKLIGLYRLGHHKQAQYLQTFAEKDPKTAVKFSVILHQNTKTTKE